MSTRANIIIKDQYDKLFFYRHSDGYPEGTLPTLEKFLNYVKEGHIRDNVGQAAGWLILIGAEEYAEYRKDVSNLCAPDFEHDFNGWKAGAYEITTGIHGDIEFLYIIDLDKKTIKTVSNSKQFKKYE